MAFLENRNGRYRIKFRFGGQTHSRSLKTKSDQKASLAKAQIERNLELVSLGMLHVPSDCDIFDFFLLGTAANNSAKEKLENGSSPNISISKIFDLYFDGFLKESIEENSYSMLQTHKNNLLRLLGKKTKLKSLGSQGLQKYIDLRAKEKGRRGNIKPVTIRKEITTLSTVFQWAVDNRHIDQIPGKKGLRYPKGKEKPPFQTWNEIQRKIDLGGLSEDQIADLWSCLFLNTNQIGNVLTHVKEFANHSVIYPMFVFAAHTGARRSEISRSELSDIDFESEMITVRELKRVRGMQSTRRVPMSPFLRSVLSNWLTDHPGGQMTFSLPVHLKRASKEREIGSSVTPDEMQDHFARTLSGSRWSVLPGWHVFRHSFCSNCAAAGVEQRVINDWVGHQTAEMVRRYRHLFPNKQLQAIRNVFM